MSNNWQDANKDVLINQYEEYWDAANSTPTSLPPTYERDTMDADQQMCQRAIEFAAADAAVIGMPIDLGLANDLYQFMKSGTLPAPPETDEK